MNEARNIVRKWQEDEALKRFQMIAPLLDAGLDEAKHLQLRQLAVALAFLTEKPFFGQPENLCHVHYRIHCTRGIIFFEKLADL